MRFAAPRRAGITWQAAAAALLVISMGRATAAPLESRIPGLFGGTLNTTIQAGVSEGQLLHFADQFRSLSAALAAARSQLPTPSASGAFRFAWDPDLDTFVRLNQSLGSGLAERAQTLGRRTGTVNVSYARANFDTLEGRLLSELSFSQAALSADALRDLPEPDQARFGDDTLDTRLNLALAFDTFIFSAAYGVTDSLDLSVALSVIQAKMGAVAETVIRDADGAGDAFFLTNAKLELASPSGHLCHGRDFRCATDSFNDSAFGTGDLFLRTKWHFADTRFADLAVVGVLTLPTGNADDFLGFRDPTFTPWLITSKAFGRLSPHLNLGYAFRSGEDVSQVQWIAGADLLAFNWLTLAADFLGYHDDKRDGINDDVLQSAVGFKLNPIGQAVIAGAFQFPLNRDGLRADVIYGGQLEWTF